MNQFLKISQQTLIQIFGKLITSLSTILILSVVSRNYGEYGTGIFTQALTYLAFFYLATDFGINAHVLKRLQSVNPGEHKKVQLEWRKLLGLRLVWAIILVILSILITPLLPFNNQLFTNSVIFGCLAILGSVIFISSNSIFQARLRYDLSVLPSSIGVVLGATVIIFFALNKQPTPYLTLGHMIGWLLTAGVSLLVIKKIIKNVLPIFDFAYIKLIFKEVWPISTTLILNVVYFRVDSFILTSFRSFAEVGIYNLAYQIFQSALVFPTFVMNAYYPLMVSQYRNDLKLFKTTLIKACLVLLGLAVFGMVVTLLVSPVLINILTGGKGFMGSIKALQILSFSYPAYFLSAVLMWVMVTVKKYKTMVLVYLIGLIVNLGLNLVFIPKYSYIAASWVTGISEYLILILQIIILLKGWKR